MTVDATNLLFEERLRALRRAYIEQLWKTSAELDLHLQNLQSGQYPIEDLEQLRLTAHGLAGSGATYGFSTISETAGRLDRYIQSILESKISATQTQLNYISALLNDLRAVLAKLPSEPASTPAIPNESPAVPRFPHDVRRIVICDPDPLTSDDIARQIANYGYSVDIFSSAEAAIDHIGTTAHSAIISDISFINSWQNLNTSQHLQLLFTATSDDFATRLKAVRAGGVAFLTKPIDLGALIDTLDTFTAAREMEPYRILIIDDQPLLAATYATTLRQAGMVVSTVTNPLRVMSTLGEFHPDVLLLDMYMPGCTGIELATVLRQQATFVGIPIVFLSAETQLDRQMDALKRGGDDFLTKPIQLDHLVTAVASRAQRARLLRSAMVRDSLTGLYNHTTTKEHLKRELARAARQDRPLTFAMIDIDHFKRVNDTYGHVVGDQVIKSLSRLLQQRLRKTDIIGRYGGEEFAIILPDTDTVGAAKLLDEIRERFSQVRQNADDMAFSSSISCGFASFPERSDAATLVSAADRALYDAKHAGRNCVMQAVLDQAERAS
ncbi:diguanylate cyclase [Chloroflexia bacterium SDU3-3]|nr:diguanylate cyclase [Chloroflexia bacterium SDU3-3]